MKDGTGGGTSERTYSDVVDDLVTAAVNGAEIVPFVGAGASYGAGLPIISEIVRYLALHASYLHHHLYDKGQSECTEPERGWLQAESRANAELLSNNGWRSISDLNQAVAWALHPRHDGDGNFPPHPGTDGLVQQPLWDLQRRANPNISSDGALRLDGSFWSPLTMALARGDHSLTDEMFAQLLRGRQPAELHRYLALLAPVLRIQLFLTINFDDLLETALNQEGVPHQVYEVPRGGELPASRMVRNNRSVVKLHGGRHGLLVGEELNRPLQPATRKALEGYLDAGEVASGLATASRIVLVLGFSGADQRIVDLLEVAIQRHWWIVWVAFNKEEAKGVFSRLPVAGGHTIVEARDVGGFCKSVYRRLKREHPASRVPMPVYGPIPTPVVNLPDGFRSELGRLASSLCHWAHRRTDAARLSGAGRVVLFEPDGPAVDQLSPSIGLAGLTRELWDHRVIWVDLECKSTLGELLADIQFRMQQVEPTLPLEVAAVAWEPPEAEATGAAYTAFFQRLALRIVGALARGRFLLALESIDAFGRKPLEHHRRAGGLDWRMRGLLRSLVDHARGAPCELGLVDSVIAVSTSVTLREGDLPRFERRVRVPRLTRRELVAPTPRSREVAAARLLLATCRRRRSEMLISQALGQESTDEWVNRRVKNGFLASPDLAAGFVAEVMADTTLLEGLDYWMDPGVRDATYDAAGQEERRRAHAWVAAFYRHRVYRGIGDIRSVQEELYHRMMALPSETGPVRSGALQLMTTIINDELLPLRHEVPPIALLRWAEAAIGVPGDDAQKLREALLRLGLGAAKDGCIDLRNSPKEYPKIGLAMTSLLQGGRPFEGEKGEALWQYCRLYTRHARRWAGEPVDPDMRNPAEVEAWARATIPPVSPTMAPERLSGEGNASLSRPPQAWSVGGLQASCLQAVEALHAVEEAHGVRRSLLNSALARSYLHNVHPDFDSAHHLLARARFAVRDEPATTEVRLVALLRQAECLLFQADHVVSSIEGGRRIWSRRSDTSPEAPRLSRLLAARDALRGARRLLDVRGAVPEQMIEFYRLRSWLKFAFLGSGKLEGAAGRLRRRDLTRRALEPIRCAFDVVLVPAETRRVDELTRRRVLPFLRLWDLIRRRFMLARWPEDPSERVDEWRSLNWRTGLVRLPENIADALLENQLVDSELEISDDELIRAVECPRPHMVKRPLRPVR